MRGCSGVINGCTRCFVLICAEHTHAQVVHAFARGRMLGVGDVLRALGASTYCLQYSQEQP